MRRKPAFRLQILEIGRDPWIGPSYPADFLPLGAPLAPGKFGRKPDLKAIPAVAWRIVWRHYDVIVLGPLQVKRTIGLSWRGRLIKRLISTIAASRVLSSLARRLLCGPHSQVAVFDVDDYSWVSKAVIAIFHPIAYFKRNLSKLELESAGFNLRVMPMAIEPFPDFALRKTRDLFICGAYTNDARKAALAAAHILRQRGFDIDIEEGSIAYQEYRRRLAAARVVISFHGYGFHTWRMYEASLARAVPVINRPPSDMVHDFLDGHNCIIVDPFADAISERLDRLLRSPQTIDRIAEQAFRLAQRKHTLEACSSSLFVEIERAVKERSTVLREQGRQGRYAKVAVR
jgi:glycosyltransferase involved in cell wall biosynthesis